MTTNETLNTIFEIYSICEIIANNIKCLLFDYTLSVVWEKIFAFDKIYAFTIGSMKALNLDSLQFLNEFLIF